MIPSFQWGGRRASFNFTYYTESSSSNGMNTRSARIVYLYGHLDTIRYKYQVRDGGLYQLLWASTIWFLWGFRKIPTLPEHWYSFAAIYYVVFMPIWVVNMGMGDSRSSGLFVLASLAHKIVFGVCIFVTGLAWYNLVMCWTGYLPLTCRESGLPNILAAVFSTFLLVRTLDVFLAYTMIMGRISQSNSQIPIKIRAKKRTQRNLVEKHSY